MTNSTSSVRPGEFDLIRTLFAPLSGRLPGAFGLTDDVAVLSPPADHELVLKADAVLEGVHFHRDDPPDTIAKKALRANISDFASKGATPRVYLLALALPPWPDIAWLKEFARGLAEDQNRFDVILAGGDTTGTPGPLSMAVTMTGFVRSGTLVRRNGARPGDSVWVTGTIGDAGGGLEVLGARSSGHATWEAELVARYRVPSPRLAFGQTLRGAASASLDVSDGLIADLGHIADVSHVRIEIDADRIPLSSALRRHRGAHMAAIVQAATAGDDYEIAFTASPTHRVHIEEKAALSGTEITEIGRVVAGKGVALLDGRGREIAVARKGYTHF